MPWLRAALTITEDIARIKLKATRQTVEEGVGGDGSSRYRTDIGSRGVFASRRSSSCWPPMQLTPRDMGAVSCLITPLASPP